jgi:hypothetical protein
MADTKGVATCRHCGAQISLFTILNRGSVQGLANAWRKRHERACAKRTVKERQAWAAPFLDNEDTSVTIDTTHPGMNEP